MITDAPPKKANREGCLESDRIKTFETPRDGRLLTGGGGVIGRGRIGVAEVRISNAPDAVQTSLPAGRVTLSSLRRPSRVRFPKTSGRTGYR